MKRSQKLNLLAMLCVLAGLLLGFAWFIVSMTMTGELLMNGPWFIAVLVTGLGAALAFAGCAAEVREQHEARQRAIALQIEHEVRTGMISADKIKAGAISAVNLAGRRDDGAL